MRKTIFTLAAVAAVVVGLSACEEKPAEVSGKSDSSKVVVDEATPVAEPEADTDVVVEGGGEAEADLPETANLGDTVEVGDWSVKVTEVALNANAVLANRNYYNEKPKGQFVLVTYEATYTGPERTASARGDLSWTLTGNDSQILDTDWQTTPADDESWPDEARQGGTVRQQVMFDINPALLSGGILSVEGYDANYDVVYADFNLPNA